MLLKTAVNFALPLEPWNRPVPPVIESVPEAKLKLLAFGAVSLPSYTASNISPFGAVKMRQPCIWGPVACKVLRSETESGPSVE
jgi:hypothetical protein